MHEIREGIAEQNSEGPTLVDEETARRLKARVKTLTLRDSDKALEENAYHPSLR